MAIKKKKNQNSGIAYKNAFTLGRLGKINSILIDIVCETLCKIWVHCFLF